MVVISSVGNTIKRRDGNVWCRIPLRKKKRIRLWTPAANMFFVSRTVYSGVHAVLPVFLHMRAENSALVGHVNSRCWSRNRVINARCSVRGSLWASLALPSLLPPPPPPPPPPPAWATVMFVCRLARCPRGRGLFTAGRSATPILRRAEHPGLNRTAPPARELAALSAKDEGECVFTPARQQMQNLAAFKQLQMFFFCFFFALQMNYSPLVLDENL